MQLSATSATSATLKLQSALEVLKAKAQQTQSVRLALVASEVQNALPEGAFTTVLAEIEKMFEKLKGWGVVEHLGDIRISILEVTRSIVPGGPRNFTRHKSVFTWNSLGLQR